MSIAKAFAYHKPSERGLEKITRLRAAYSALMADIDSMCPPSRERSLAVTKLEISAMWAIQSVVYNDTESKAEGGAA